MQTEALFVKQRVGIGLHLRLPFVRRQVSKSGIQSVRHWDDTEAACPRDKGFVELAPSRRDEDYALSGYSSSGSVDGAVRFSLSP
jgi:hypothetical protein